MQQLCGLWRIHMVSSFCCAYQIHRPLRGRASYPYRYRYIDYTTSHVQLSSDGLGLEQDDELEQLKNTFVFNQFDLNSDDKVSLSELKNGLEKELKVCKNWVFSGWHNISYVLNREDYMFCISHISCALLRTDYHMHTLVIILTSIIWIMVLHILSSLRWKLVKRK